MLKTKIKKRKKTIESNVGKRTINNITNCITMTNKYTTCGLIVNSFFAFNLISPFTAY